MNKWINAFLTLFFLIAFFSGLLGANLILISSLLFIFIILSAYFWSIYAFSKFTFKCNLTRKKVEYQQQLNFSIEIENKKLLPLLWLKVENFINKNIEFSLKNIYKEIVGKDFNIFRDTITLKWYEKIRRSYEIKPKQRGLYHFGKGRIFYNGILGLFNNQFNLDHTQYLIVYPQILPLSVFNLNKRELFGVKPQRGWIYKDPLNKVGLKPYQSSDSIRDINWKASARHQNLESNIYKPSYLKELHLFLVNTKHTLWEEKGFKQEVERSIVCAASMVEEILKNDLNLNFYTNLLIKQGQSVFSTKKAPHTSQREKIMTLLALLKPYTMKKVELLMKNQKPHIKQGSRIIIISLGINQQLLKMLNIYNKYFDPVLILVGNDKNETRVDFIPLYKIKGKGNKDESKTDESKTMELVNGNKL